MALDFRTIDFNNLMIPPLTKGNKGGLSTTPQYLNPTTKQPAPLIVQFPIGAFPFGLSERERDDGSPSYNLTMGLSGYKTNELMKQFFNFCINGQDFLCHLAATNSQTWFNKTHDVNVCSALMNDFVKMPPADKPYDPNIKLTVRASREGVFYAKAYDTDGTTEIQLSEIEAKSMGRCRAKLSSIYVINGKFGWVWDLERVWLTSKPTVAGVGMNPDMYGEPAPAAPTQPTTFGALPPMETEENLADMYQEEGASAGGVKREREEEAPDNEDEAPDAKRNK